MNEIKRNVFIDIDGVLLIYRSPPDDQPTFPMWNRQVLAPGALDFLAYVCEHHNPYFLSSWGIQGRREKIDRHLLPHLGQVCQGLPVTFWDGRDKTTGLLMGDPMPWLWVEDEAYHLADNCCPEYRIFEAGKVAVATVRGGSWQCYPYPLADHRQNVFASTGGGAGDLLATLDLLRHLDEEWMKAGAKV
jgi:hypothetical protein